MSAVLVAGVHGLAGAQVPADILHVTHEPHARPGAPTVVSAISNRVPFDLAALLPYDPGRGPIPAPCVIEPLGCLGLFSGGLVGATSVRGRLDLAFNMPRLSTPPVPFLMLGVDSRTRKWAASRLQTFIFKVPFAYRVIDPNQPRDPHCKALGDIDGDGLLDALAASSSGEDGLYWYDYAQGWAKHRIATGNFTTDMQAADLDGDGDVDVVIPSSTFGELRWYENPRPSGNPRGPWTAHVLGGAGSTHDVEVGDLEGDGDLDIVTRAAGGLITTVWVQRSPGNWTGVVAHTRGGEGTALGDMDRDGDLDIVHNGFWVETPSDPATGSYIQHDFASGWPALVGVHAADMDCDGRLDVVIAPSETASGRLSWYRAPANPRAGGWQETVIDGDVSFLHTFKAADMDNDGDLDVVTAEMHQARDRYVGIYYCHDNGARWHQEVLSATGSHNLRVGDIGGDGDLDVFGANWNNGAAHGAPIEYWENQLNGYKRPKLPLNRWARRVVDPNKPWVGMFVEMIDLDRDRRREIITAGHYYRYSGSPGGGWTRRAFGGALFNVIAVADFDRDLDFDVLGTNGKPSGNQFTWAENDGFGNFTLHRNVPDGAGDFLQGVAVATLTPASRCQIGLSWHIGGVGTQLLEVPDQPASQPWRWSRISTLSQDEALSSGDLDGDGRLDLLQGTRWLRNTGGGWQQQTLNPTGGKPDRNRLADINGDGRMDAVIGYEAGSALERVAWYEAPASPGGTWTEHVIARIISPMSLDVGDIDHDGDIDVVAGEHNLAQPAQARVIIFENVDRRGGKWRQHVVHVGDEHHDGTRLADVDSDGDLDIASIGYNNPAIVLYENLALP
ncbi:MAG: VCBS repeat-containing protein [Planctomycetota bacterium]